MQEPTVIRHSMLMALRLIDATTGRAVNVSTALVYADHSICRPFRRDDGYLIFLELPPDGTEIRVEIRGFEPYVFRLSYEELKQDHETLQLQLFPDEKDWSNPCKTLSGVMPGISELDAVRIEDESCLMREYDERRKIITIFNPHHLELDMKHYAICDPDHAQYEAIEIVERISDTKFRAAEPVVKEFRNYFPVVRRIMGKIGPAGEYMLRVRDDSMKNNWLVRWKADGQEYFQTIDFAQERPAKLAAPSPEDNADGS